MTHVSGVERKMMSGFVPIRVESNEEGEIWVQKVLLLFRSDAGRVWEGDETTLVQRMEGALPPKAVNDALGCVCLQGVTAEGGENASEMDRL